jgi:ferrous iron transport protein A
VLINIEGGHDFRSRLAALGFTPGTQLQVVQNLGRGPMIVSLRDTRIALGRGEARKIHVSIAAEES